MVGTGSRTPCAGEPLRATQGAHDTGAGANDDCASFYPRFEPFPYIIFLGLYGSEPPPGQAREQKNVNLQKQKRSTSKTLTRVSFGFRRLVETDTTKGTVRVAKSDRFGRRSTVRTPAHELHRRPNLPQHRHGSGPNDDNGTAGATGLAATCD